MLRGEEELTSATVRPESWPPERPIRLNEAWADDGLIVCNCRWPQGIPTTALRLVLTQADEADKEVGVADGEDDRILAEIPKPLQARVDRYATIVRVAASQHPGPDLESNSVLLVNLRDIRTGRSLRRERYVEQAQQDADGFDAVMTELAGLGQQDALIDPLYYCDIRIDCAYRPRRAPGKGGCPTVISDNCERPIS